MTPEEALRDENRRLLQVLIKTREQVRNSALDGSSTSNSPLLLAVCMRWCRATHCLFLQVNVSGMREEELRTAYEKVSAELCSLSGSSGAPSPDKSLQEGTRDHPPPASPEEGIPPFRVPPPSSKGASRNPLLSHSSAATGASAGAEERRARGQAGGGGGGGAGGEGGEAGGGGDDANLGHVDGGDKGGLGAENLSAWISGMSSRAEYHRLESCAYQKPRPLNVASGWGRMHVLERVEAPSRQLRGDGDDGRGGEEGVKPGGWGKEKRWEMSREMTSMPSVVSWLLPPVLPHLDAKEQRNEMAGTNGNVGGERMSLQGVWVGGGDSGKDREEVTQVSSSRVVRKKSISASVQTSIEQCRHPLSHTYHATHETRLLVSSLRMTGQT